VRSDLLVGVHPRHVVVEPAELVQHLGVGGVVQKHRRVRLLRVVELLLQLERVADLVPAPSHNYADRFSKTQVNISQSRVLVRIIM
jgi:hypothetical protein